MWTYVGFAFMVYLTGWIFVKLTGGKSYYTSVVDEFANPVTLGDLTKQEDGRTLVRSKLVFFIGAMFWLGVFLLCAFANLLGLFDVITPLRLWLFGPSLSFF